MEKLDFLIKIFEEKSPILIAFLFLNFIVKNYKKINSIINSINGNEVLNDYLLSKNEETKSIKALKEIKENRVFKSLGYPYMERPLREALLRLHEKFNGYFSHIQVFAIKSNALVVNDEVEIRQPFNKLFKLWSLVAFGIIFYLAFAFLLGVHIYYFNMGVTVSLDIYAFICSFLCMACAYFAAPEICTLKIRKYLKNKKRRK